MSLNRVHAVFGALLLSSCVLDLELPEAPQQGSLVGIVDTSPIDGAGHAVVLVDTNGQKLTVNTEANGAFRFPEVLPGLYALDVRIDGFAPLVVPNVRVKSGEAVDVGVLEPLFLQDERASGFIRGRVTNGAGGAVAGTSLQFFLPSSTSPLTAAVADADGNFDAPVTSGTWRLVARHPWYAEATLENVVVAEGQTVDLRMSPIVLSIRPATISGVVLVERDGQPTTAAQGATVTLSTGATTTTDADGKYVLTGVVAGTHTLRAQLAQYADPLPSRTITVEPDGLMTADTITLELLRGSVRGTVETADGAPADGITASLAPVGYGAAAAVGMVSSRAQYLITSVPYGDYTLTLSKQGYFRASLTVRVDAPSVNVSNTVLAPQSGDFLIDDLDPDNTPTFTRTANVTVVFTNTANATEMRISEDQAFTGVNFVTFQNNRPITLTGTEGVKTLYVQLKDNTGTVGPTLSSSITLDTTPPAAPSLELDSTGVSGAGLKFTNSNVTLPLRVLAQDTLSGVSGMRLSGTGAATGGLLTTPTLPYQSDAVFNRAVTTDGVQTVYAQVIDNAGNASAIVSDVVVVDRAVPSGAITALRGPGATADGYTNQLFVDVQVAVGAEPDGGSVQVKLANAAGPDLDAAQFQTALPVVSWYLGAQSDGLKTIHAQFRDTAGNLSAPLNTTITYDVTAPSPVSANVTPAISPTTSVTVNVASSAGDLSATEAVTVSENPSFTAAGTVGPMAMPGSGQIPFTLSSGDGVHTVYVRFKDRAGNTSVVTAQVTLDDTPPSAPNFSLVATGTRGNTKFTKNGTSLPFTLTGVDALSGVAQMRLSTSPAVGANGLLTTGTTSPWAASGAFARAAGDAPVTVYAQLIDAAGNASAVVSDTIVVDTSVPSGTVNIARGAEATVDGFTNSGVVNVSLTAPAEPNGGGVTFKMANTNGIELTQAAFQELSPTVSWFLSNGEGSKTVYVVFRDSAGNESTPVTANITYDLTAPTPATATITPATTRVLGVTVAVASSAGDLSPTTGLTLSESSSFSGSGTVGPMAMPGGGTVGFTLSNSGDGLRTIYVRFRDRAGNSTIVPATVTVDSTPPSGTIDVTGTLADGVTTSRALTATTDVRVGLRVSGATEYFLGTGSLTTCPSSGYTAMPPNGEVLTTVAGGAEGVRELRGCFRDAAGNVFGGAVSGGWAPSTSITFDGTAPTGCVVTATGRRRDGSPSTVNGKTAATKIPVTISGCVGAPVDMAIVAGSVTCNAGASLQWQRYSGTVDFTLPNQDGLTAINACVRDQALNVGSMTGTSMTLDTQAPTGAVIAIDSPQANGFTNVTAPVITGSADDATSWGLSESSRGPFTSLAYSATPSTTTYTFSSPGRKRLFAQFVDDVGNASAPVEASVTVDTTAPAVPRFYSVDFDNRGARLFWDPVTDASGILRYELWCGVSSAAAKCAEVDGTRSDGWVLNLPNRRDQVFAVRAVDSATNASPLSTTIAGAVGFRRIAVPFNSAYSVQPFDIATRGDDIYVTYSERDANWTNATGNLKIAVSNDRGLTWRFNPLDDGFGGERQVGRIGFVDDAVIVTTAGTPADVATSEVKVYRSTNSGTSWAQVTNASLATDANFAAAGTGLGLITNGARVGVYYRNNASADLRIAYSNASGASVTLASAAYYTLPSSSVTQLKSCGGNYSLVHAWKNGSTLQALTHYFFNQNTANVAGGEASLSTVLSGSGAGNTFSSYDLACVSLPEATQSYLVYTASPNALYFRRKLAASTGFLSAVSLATDADLSQAPRVWAGSRNVYALYRNTSNELMLLESRDEGVNFSAADRTRLARGASDGIAAVLSGENSEDVAVAFTDATGTSLTLMVPALPSVRSVGEPGLTTSRLSWTPVSGIDRYQVAQGASLLSPFTDFNYASVVSYDVPSAATPQYFSIRAIDAQGMPGNDGNVWHAQPSTVSTVLTGATSTTGVLSSSAGIVAYNQNALLLPPWGLKASGTYDLTVYRTSNGGVSWSPYSWVTSTTTAARALVGFGNRAFLFYRLSSLAGVRARFFSDLTGTVASEVVVDNTLSADFISARADVNNSRVLVAYVNAATDVIRSAYTTDGTTYTLGTSFAVPTAGANTTIDGLEVVKLDGARSLLTWRQTTSGVRYVYTAESTNYGSTWGTPTLVVTGTSGESYSTYLVSPDTIVTGAGNAAYSFVANVTELNLAYFKGDNLYVSVTGTDMGAFSSHFSRFVLDRDSVLEGSIDAFSNGDGQYLAYTTEEPGGGQHRLKLAYCPTECHRPFNWRRTILETYASANAWSPTVAVAQSSTPIFYVAYQYSTGSTYELRVARGGVNRLAR